MLDVVGALIKKDDKYLICQRASGTYAGYWEFPGGKVEEGEDPGRAIEREIQEELEIKVSAKTLFDISYYEGPKRTIKLMLYNCDYISGEIKLNVHTDYKFVTKEELDTFEFCPADVYFLDFIKKR